MYNTVDRNVALKLAEKQITSMILCSSIQYKSSSPFLSLGKS